MAEMITRCPKCETAFRITPGHLRSARGSVRCGSCLQVFNARENLTESSLKALAAANAEERVSAHDGQAAAAQAQALPQTQPPQTPSPTPPQPESDDILISDDMELANEESDADEAFPPPSPREQTSLFERAARERDSDEEEDEDAEDESWALKLLDDDDPTPIDNLRTRPVAEEGDCDEQVRGDMDYVLYEDEDEYREELFESNNSYEYELPENDEPELAPAENDEDADIFEPQPIAASRRETTGSAYLDAIEPEPVEFAVRAERPFWRSRLLWAGLSLLALLALLGQVAWLQYPALNRVEPYRGFYAIACDVLGCQLPPQIDLQAIRTSNLVVRSHPRQQNALMVDVVLQNTAPFAQPFPVLKLTFSDLDGEAVAQRRFSPNEYLGGELAGQNTMPVRQPVHIAMEIVDPGSNAVNYRIEVVSSSGG